MTTQGYVLNDAEVKLTGRTADRKVGTQTATLVEVTPYSADDGTWKKWVPLASLFAITESKE